MRQRSESALVSESKGLCRLLPKAKWEEIECPDVSHACNSAIGAKIVC